MATYLLLRPYGDARGAESVATAEALASPMWVVAHVAGAAALVSLAALWALLSPGPYGWAAAIGAALALPYYGAETFALHAIGARTLAGDPDLLVLVSDVREDPAAMTLFGLGLITLAAAGIGVALEWRREHDRGRVAGALLPLAVTAALFLPQFFLPPAGRMAYGVLFAAAAGYAAFAAANARSTSSRPADSTGAGAASASRTVSAPRI